MRKVESKASLNGIIVCSGPTSPAKSTSTGNLTRYFGYQISKFRRCLLNLIVKNDESRNLIQGYLADIERLDSSFRQLRNWPEPVIVDGEDHFMARRLVGIASTYGFRCCEPLVTGSLNFLIVYPEYRQTIRVWTDAWPKGLIMFLGGVETFRGQRQHRRIPVRPQPGCEPVFTRDEIIPEFVRLLELSLKMRTEYLRDTNSAEA